MVFVRPRSIAIAFAAAILAAPHAARPQALPDALIEKAMAAWQVPGLAVAAVRNGRTVAVRGFGRRNVERGLPVTRRTLFATLRPATAISLGIASLLALVTAVGIPLAAEGMGRTGPVVAALAVVTYMLLSGAVTVPLLAGLSRGRGGSWRLLR